MFVVPYFHLELWSLGAAPSSSFSGSHDDAGEPLFSCSEPISASQAHLRVCYLGLDKYFFGSLKDAGKPFFCFYENCDMQHKFIKNQICWPSFEKDDPDYLQKIIMDRPLCKAPAKPNGPDHLPKIIVERPLCKTPSHPDDLNHLQKIIVDRPLCKTPAHPDYPDHLQKIIVDCPLCKTPKHLDD